MAASGDITFSGDRQAKLHPFLATLVRWCVSCLWSTATVLLHRLMAASYPAITAPKPQQKPAPKQRAPGTDHLHPVPKVECVVLHEPPSHTLDVIFVHGLYGSLGNTWRQGDWKSKYKIDPNIVPLRKHERTPCKCNLNKNNELFNFTKYKINEDYTVDNLNEAITFKDLNDLKKMLPNDKSLITEQFYNNTLLDQVDLSSYEIQARFVEDMFRNENGYDIKQNVINNDIKCKCNNVMEINECKCKVNDVICKDNEVECKVNDVKYKDNEIEFKNNEVEYKVNGYEVENNKVKCRINEKKTCETGCGCICDECYSLCWPKDWIKVDFPGARVISINYTSDPYLWRPLWVKGNKRLRLHERAEQMMRQLTEMGVGDKPIIWVGHSKGGLFIKQIYCEAYEAYLNETKSKQTNDINESDNNIVKQNVDNKDIINARFNESDINNDTIQEDIISNENKIFKDSNVNCDEAVNDNETNNKTEINLSNSKLIEVTKNNISILDNDIEEQNKSEIYNIDCKRIMPNNVIVNNMVQSIDNTKDSNKNDNFTDNNVLINGINDEKLRHNEVGKIINNITDIDNNIEESNLDDMNTMEESKYMSMKDNDVTDINENKRDKNGVGHDEKNSECDRFVVKNDEKHLIESEELGDGDAMSSSNTEGQTVLSTKAGVWKNSVGFMFYSVPHRGSPLADIKTPITARSIELLEISKDCALVLSLQERWLVATRRSQPVVRSLVETCRTLMSVLWLRIVSVDSADAGIGTLSGVSVDHREICKPSSRHCQLYRELTDLIHAALHKCNCEK